MNHWFKNKSQDHPLTCKFEFEIERQESFFVKVNNNSNSSRCLMIVFFVVSLERVWIMQILIWKIPKTAPLAECPIVTLLDVTGQSKADGNEEREIHKALIHNPDGSVIYVLVKLNFKLNSFQTALACWFHLLFDFLYLSQTRSRCLTFSLCLTFCSVCGGLVPYSLLLESIIIQWIIFTCCKLAAEHRHT